MGTDPAQATIADVELAIRRRLRCLPDGADPVAAVMSVVGPVLEARDAEIRRLRAKLPT
jgi:hypothetical protein